MNPWDSNERKERSGRTNLGPPILGDHDCGADAAD